MAVGGMSYTAQLASAQMTADLAKAVRGIVSDVNQSYLKDGCFAILTQLKDAVPASRSDQERTSASAAVEACQKFLSAATLYESQQLTR